jgi:dolichyl-phosphate beta-glucosyltransferase
MRLSVVIPVYNESHRIENTLSVLTDYLSTFYPDYEVLVANDGSKDDTVKIVRDFERRNVRLLDNGVNHGKGYVVRQGMLEATGDYILFMDADMATPIDQLPLFIKALDAGANFAYGIRTYQKYEKKRRLILGLGMVALAHIIVLSKPVIDTQCGFKAFRRDVSRLLFRKMRISGGTFDIEMFFLSQLYNLEGVGIPVFWNNVPGSRINMLKCVLFDPIDMIRIRLNHIMGYYKR